MLNAGPLRKSLMSLSLENPTDTTLLSPGNRGPSLARALAAILTFPTAKKLGMNAVLSLKTRDSSAKKLSVPLCLLDA